MSPLDYAYDKLKAGVGYQNAAMMSGVSVETLRALKLPPRRSGPIRAREPLQFVRVPALLEPWPLKACPDALKEAVRQVAAERGVTLAELASRDRSPRVCDARQYAFHAVREACPWISVATIGRIFGRDHSTVLFGLRQHAARVGKGAE